MISLKQLGMKPICLAVAICLCVLLPTLGMAGEAPVQPNCTDCSGTFFYNIPPSGSCGGVCVALVSSGGISEVEIAPGVTATTMCTTTACSTSVLSLDQIEAGFGSGGSAVTLSEDSAELVAAAGKDDVAMVKGQPFSPIGALSTLATTPVVDEISVEMPCGIVVPLATILTNVATAITSKDATLMGTTLNDAAIAMTVLLKDNSQEVSEELLDAFNTIKELLLSARDSK